MLSLFILVSVASATSSYLSKVDNEYVYVEILNRCLPTVYSGIQLYARTTLNENGETYATKYYYDDGCRILYTEASTSSLEGAQVGELPATVAYKLTSFVENCEKEELIHIIGYRTGCNPYIAGETTYYVQSSVTSTKVTVQAYTDEECNSPIEENDLISNEYDCDTCIEEDGDYVTIYCKALEESIFGTGSTEEPEPVDANTIQEIESKHKYMVIPQESMIAFTETDKCFAEGQTSMYIIVPSSDFIIMCNYEGSATCEAPEGTQLNGVCNILPLSLLGGAMQITDTLPEHVAGMKVSENEECNDLVEGMGLLFPEGCQQLMEQQNPMARPEVVGSVQYVIEEGKVKGTIYTDGECTAPDAEATPVEYECNSCVEQGEAYAKIHCGPLSGGAFNTFLLLALVLIAFIF